MEQKLKKIKPMVRLSQSQIDSKKEFIRQYIEAENASSGSTVDSNANVSVKTVATLGAELNKDICIQINRSTMCDYIEKYFDRETAEDYVKLLEEHTIYKHDETSPAPYYPYCVAINMYPFLEHGMTKLGGESTAPKHLESYCGSLINLIFAISSQFAGACNGYNQPIMYEHNGVTYSKKFGDFVNSFSLNNMFSNYQGIWEYADISTLGYKVSEDGKFVNINKVYRRKYGKKLYRIKTSSGYCAEVSEDHIFKVLFRGRELEVKAKDLLVNDTVFMNKDMSLYIHKDSEEFKKGFLVGIICGDGNLTDEPNVRLSVNNNQDYVIQTVNNYLQSINLPVLNINDGNKCLDCRKYSNELYNFFKQYIIGVDCYSKHIDVEKYSLDFLVGFLDGLFTADGSYSENRGISITLTNKELINNVKDIVKKLYIKTNSIKVIPENKNKKESYNLYISSRIIKYLNITPYKIIHRNKLTNIDNSREVYYYGNTAFKQIHSNVKHKVKPISDSNQDVEYKTDVISEIEIIDNYDDYVYEIETETHWYNDGGFITHNCATAEALLYFHYFAQKDYGKDYLKTHTEMIKAKLQHVIYSINQPASARGFQSVFYNLSVFDKYFFESMFGHFYFPDGTHIEYDEFNEFQKFFMEWLLQERKKTLLTFPVLTEASLDENGEPKDKEWADFCADIRSRGLSFFSYNSETADALASCVTGDSLIKIFDTVENKSYYITIEDFIKKVSSTKNDNINKTFDNCRFNVEGVNPETNEIVNEPVTGVLKKHYTGNMFTVSVNGKKLKVTEDHVFFVKNKKTGEVLEMTAKDLFTDDTYKLYQIASC